VAADNLPLRSIDTDQTDLDFAVFVGTKPVGQEIINKLLAARKDPRVLIWAPAEHTHEERDRLVDFAAYRKLIADWQGKDTEDAVAVINWVANALQTGLGGIAQIVRNSYGHGRVDALNNSQMEFHVAGELSTVLSPLVDRVLCSTYESKDIQFDPPFVFRREEGVKVINGIVKAGNIPKNTKPNQNISAAQNFGFGLKIMKKSAEKQLDASDNPYVTDLWQFIDDKLTGDGQTMKVETLYKNFMGIGGPKDYGLTRRMVQIFILCLVREGKVRLTASGKSGLPSALIDYSNLESIDFSAKILDSLVEVQKVAKPENWEVLRPYAEKLLGEELPVTNDDSVISSYRARLRNLFAKEKEESGRAQERAKSFFEAVKAKNPYETILKQIVDLFASDIEGGNDINLMLHALKAAMGYQAFDSNASSPTEVDDLANRLKNYHDLRQFLTYESELLTAFAYCSQPVPEKLELTAVRREQSKLSNKLRDLQPFIDSEVKLKTELVGKTPPESGESGTLGALIHEYTTAYAAMHDSVLDSADGYRKQIEAVVAGNEFKALQILEGITALKPPVSGQLAEHLATLAQVIFSCPSPSRNSVIEQLKRGPTHECSLSFQSAGDCLGHAESLAKQAANSFDSAVNAKMEIFLTPAVRTRLEQGRSEPVVSQILACSKIEEVRSVLTQACLDDPSVVQVINRYLKRIIVKRVKMAEFKPSMSTIEESQIPLLAKEFQDYLQKAINEVHDDKDTLPMIQVE